MPSGEERNESSENITRDTDVMAVCRERQRFKVDMNKQTYALIKSTFHHKATRLLVNDHISTSSHRIKSNILTRLYFTSPKDVAVVVIPWPHASYVLPFRSQYWISHQLSQLPQGLTSHRPSSFFFQTYSSIATPALICRRNKNFTYLWTSNCSRRPRSLIK